MTGPTEYTTWHTVIWCMVPVNVLCWWWSRNSQACRSIFSIFTLHLYISVNPSIIALLSLQSVGALWDKKVFPKQPHKVKISSTKCGLYRAGDCFGTKKCSLTTVTVNTCRQRNNIRQVFSFSCIQTQILKPLSQYMVSCMHHCYQGDHFLAFFWVICYKGFLRNNYKLLHFHRHFTEQNYSFVTGLSLFIYKKKHCMDTE